MKNELVVLEKLEVVPFFTKGDSVDEILAKIDAEARAHVPDLSTSKTRSEITKNINEIVTKSKAYLEESGKNLSAEYKAMPKVIDANRKKVKDFLTNLQAELRQPLTDWDNEQKRIKEEKAAKEEADRIAIEIDTAHELALFMDEKFNAELEAKLIAEYEAEKQRLADEESARIAREEEIRKEESEKAAKKEKELIESRINTELNYDWLDSDGNVFNSSYYKSQKSRIEAIKIDDSWSPLVEDAKKVQLRVIQQLEMTIEKVIIDEANVAEFAEKEKERIEMDNIHAEALAENRRLNDIAQAKIDAENAAEEKRLAEEKRKQDELDAIEADRVKREADNKHTSMIMKQTKESLMAIGLSQEDAKAVTLALKNGKITNVGKINF